MIIGNRNWATVPYQGWDFRTSLQGGVNRIEMSLISHSNGTAQYFATPNISLNHTTSATIFQSLNLFKSAASIVCFSILESREI